MPHPMKSASEKQRLLLDALQQHDYATVQAFGRHRGGYAGLRSLIWPVLLGVDVEAVQSQTRQGSSRDSGDLLPPHPDEKQVALDVHRSFVSYPKGLSDEEQTRLRQCLSTLIVSTLRRYPKLHYFQGYHDIVSVLLLAFEDKNTSKLQENLVQACVQKLSLHRIRDSMLKGMEPTMGYLRIMQKILSLADPKLAMLVAATSNLPIFSLSWILTLTAHDLSSLPVALRLFDFLLSEEPIMVAYMGASICMMKRKEIDELLEEAEQTGDLDPGMIHHVMARLPPMKCENNDDDDEKPGKEDTFTFIEDDKKSKSSMSQSDHEEPHGEKDYYLHSDAFDHPADQVPPPNSNTVPRKPELVSVEDLIRHTLDLYTRFPTTDRRLEIKNIMGPKSCIFTWFDSKAGHLSDSDAELLVDVPLQQVVKPQPLSTQSTRLYVTLRNSMSRMKKSGKWVVAMGIFGLAIAICVDKRTTTWLLQRGWRNWGVPLWNLSTASK